MRPARLPRAAPIAPIAGALLFVACAALLCTWGSESGAERLSGLANTLTLGVNAGLLAAAYLLAGVGYGRPLMTLLRRGAASRDAGRDQGGLWLQAPLGIGALLFLSHGLGVAGLLSGPVGMWVGWGVVAAGLLLLADQVVRGPLRPEKWPALPTWSLLGIPALAVMIVAACSPPGSLWLGAQSEGGAYDVLSYHLQLPKEWIAQGSRLWPTRHNVYSFLPSAMEAAYLHIGALTRGGLAGGGSFVAGAGVGVIACQFVHAGLALLTALLCGKSVALIARRGGAEAGPDFSACIAAGAVLGIPWVMVVGSLAYNDLGVTAMLAGAILASLVADTAPAARGAAVGFLMGIACSVKPTALFLAAPVAGLFLLFARREPLRARLQCAAAGAVAGAVTLAPWMLRNWAASGNPLFPFAHALFGDAHWTAAQFARYSSAHAFHGSLADRLALFFDAERGILNEQWAIAFPLGAVGVAWIAARPATRRIGLLLAAGVVAQVVGWMFLTHLRSRFLVPAVVPLGMAIGLGAGRIVALAERRSADRQIHAPLRRAGMVVAAIIPLSLAGWSWLIFMSQRGGHPNQVMAYGGVGLLTGAADAAEIAQLPPGRQREALEQLAPAPYVNFTIPPGHAVYFVGSAAPLYFLPPGGTRAVVYHTTWDTSPLGDAVRRRPDDPAAWTDAVRATRSDEIVDFVLVDIDELNRLRESGWYDEAVTPEAVRRWLVDRYDLVRAWPTGEGTGTFLFREKRGAGGNP